MIPRHVFHRRLLPAPLRNVFPFPLVGLGFAEVIPFDFSFGGVVHRSGDLTCVPTHHLPVSEEQDASFTTSRQVRRQRRWLSEDEEPLLLRSHLLISGALVAQ